jgi:hypothetical protein
VIELGWEEWLVLIAVIMFAIKVGLDAIFQKIFKKDHPHFHLNDPSNGSDQHHSSGGDRTVALSVQPRLHHTNEDGDQTTVNITNIEIHDSIINRSTIGIDAADDNQ